MSKLRYLICSVLSISSIVNASPVLDSILPQPLTQIPESSCIMLKMDTDEVKGGLPEKLGASISFYDVNTVIDEKGCQLTYQYEVKTNMIAEMMSYNNGLSIAENIEWLKDDAGNKAFSDTLYVQLSALIELTMKDMLSYRGFKVIYEYRFDLPEIKKITVIAADTGGRGS